MTQKELDKWIKERDQAAKSYDLKKFRAFYEKYRKKGVYKLPLPKDDHVLELSMRKMVCNMASATDQEKAEAAEWLYSHNSTPSMV